MRRLLLLLALLPTPALPDSFVLVHGAFAGPWAWDRVTPLLEAQGHEVHAVALAGAGPRAAENGPHISPEDHIGDILSVIRAARPPVILVAHSHGGRAASGAWDRARDLVAHAVWVEAPAPLLAEGLPADDRSLATVVTMYPDAASEGMLPPPPVRAGRYPEPLLPMSLRALYGAVPIAAPLPGDTPATFITADASSLPGLRALGEALRDERGWTLETLPGGHDLPWENPEGLSALLLAIADRTD